MKLLLYSLLLAALISSLSFGQVTLTQTAATAGPLQTGYVVVTPLTGIGEGLSVSETFGQQIGASVFQTSVLGSPLVTLTDVVLSVNSLTGSDTGIAIVNPGSLTATITLIANNQQGATVATRTITVGSRQQISAFVSQLFAGDPNFIQGITGLLFISSNVPIAVVALAFSGGTFTSLPVAAQLSATNTTVTATSAPITVTTPVTATVTTSPVTTAGNGVTITGPVAITSAPVTPTFSGIPSPPTLLPPPTATTPPGTITIPVTGSPSSLVTSTGAVTAFATPPPAATTPLNLVLPQVATGGGWVTQITIANTSTAPQTVRVDFFSPTGTPLATPVGSTLPSVVIQPGGVARIQL